MCFSSTTLMRVNESLASTVFANLLLTQIFPCPSSDFRKINRVGLKKGMASSVVFLPPLRQRLRNQYRMTKKQLPPLFCLQDCQSGATILCFVSE